jgi:hypothetical protein
MRLEKMMRTGMKGVRIDDKLNLLSGGGDILIQGKTTYTKCKHYTGYGNAGVGIYGP